MSARNAAPPGPARRGLGMLVVLTGVMILAAVLSAIRGRTLSGQDLGRG